MILFVISFLIFAAYVAYAVRLFGAPWSLSDTFYKLAAAGRPQWLFQAAMIGCAAMMLPAWLDAAPEGLQFLAFLTCAGVIFIGAAPLFKDEHLEKWVHLVATVVAGLCAFAWSFAVCWPAPALLLLAAVIVMSKYRKWVFWAEIAAFASVYLTVFLRLIG